MTHPDFMHDSSDDDDATAVLALLHQRVPAARNRDPMSVCVGVFPDNVILAAHEHAGRPFPPVR